MLVDYFKAKYGFDDNIWSYGLFYYIILQPSSI